MKYTIEKPEDRRELDSFVRAVYDATSDAGDRMSKSTYTMLIQGGANALHRFGRIFVPGTSALHMIETT